MIIKDISYDYHKMHLRPMIIKACKYCLVNREVSNDTMWGPRLRNR